jgi:amino acid adenylation domain-containing protein/non-ribosomal peptide synthase protein (TIGR01720 family)/FkbM family methyltransferase
LRREVRRRAEIEGTAMSTLAQRIAALSPEKRALLEKHLLPGRSCIPRLGAASAVCAPAQERMWFNHYWDPEAPVYTESVVLRVRGPLRNDRLETALQEVVRRHEILRTYFRSEGGELRQHVVPVLEMRLAILEAAEPREEELRRHAETEARRVFQPDRLPLVRLASIRAAADDHLVVLTAHHIVFDGWSAGIFFRELFAHYAGNAEPLPPLPVQYADFAAWQRASLGSGQMARELAFWKQVLQPPLPAMELPADRTRPALRVPAGARLHFVISRPVACRVEELAKREGATPMMVLLAVFEVLLHRWTGQDDVLVGVPATNRDLTELEPLIGNFVNTLVYRSNFADAPAFRDLLDRTRQFSMEAHAHKHLPFERLLDELHLPRDASRTPLFQAAFDYQKLPVPEAPPGLSVTYLEIENGTSKFDLGLSIRHTSGGLLGQLEYSTALFDAATIARLARNYRTLLESALAEPHARVSRLPLLSAEERHTLLCEWNDTAAELPETTLASLFEARVKIMPDSPAVKCGGEVWTFRDLDARADRVAGSLRRLGVHSGEPVGLWADRSLHSIAGLWGIWKAGAAYVPLEPAHPSARLEFMAADAGLRILVANGATAFGDTFLPVDPAGAGPLEESGEQATPDTPAYVIYTSGSTGGPKGVVVAQRSVVNLLGALRAKIYRELPERLTVSVNGSLGFDTSVKQIVQLLDGHTLELIPEDVRMDPQRMTDYLAERRIDVLDCTPTQLTGLIDAGLLREDRGGPRVVLLGGEPIFGSQWETLSRARHIRFYNLYGPTECTVDATCALVGADSLKPTIGRPLANVRVYILDRELQPAPPGVYGELAVAGAGVAQGYVNRPELTAARFVADPFASDLRERMYRTGDFARYLPDGTIEFRGRADSQIKWHGFRIELDEIENELKRVPDVREAAVVLADAGSSHPKLLAFVEPEAKRRASAEGRPRRRLPNGLAIVEINPNETDFLYRDVFENRAYLRHGIAIGPGDCIVDAGANIGMFSLFAHLCAEGVRIYSIEPNPAAFEVLRINTQLYGLDACLLQRGLSNGAGSRGYTHYPAFTSLSGLYGDVEAEKRVVRSFTGRQETWRGPAAVLNREADSAFEELLDSRFRSEALEIEVITLSGMIAECGIERIDLLKINVEKSEMDVLQGIAEDDWPKIRQIAMEVHDLDGRLETVRSLLGDRGYQVAVEEDWQLEADARTNYYVYATMPGTRPASSAECTARQPCVPETLLTGDEVRRALAGRLPHYMLPTSIAIRDALPVTPNGKIDRAALSLDTGCGEPATKYVAPRTPAEKTLAALWAETLGLARAGIHDNFFELGGDSILSVQIVTRAAQAGLRLTTKDIFQHKTIARLCEGISAEAPASVERDTCGGPWPLTPIQAKFLEEFQDAPGRDHFNQWMLLDLPDNLQRESVRRALAELVERHEALRFRFARTPDGWRQMAAPCDPAFEPAVWDFDHEPESAAATAQWHDELNLERGPVFCAALSRPAAGQPGKLLLVAHHMAIDAASWRILLEEFALLCGATGNRGPAPLPPPAYPFGLWAQRLQEYSRRDAALAEMPFWLSQNWRGAAFTERSTSAGSIHEAHVSFDPEQTERLLSAAPRACHATVEELLLAALAQALSEWTGNPRLWIDVESQGRDHPLEQVDISRTVGWFTAVFPVLLDLRGATTAEELLSVVKERRRSVPQRGFAYGILRHLREETARELRSVPQPEVLFNYLGRLGSPEAADGTGIKLVSGGLSRDPRMKTGRALQVDVWVAAGRLEVLLTAASDAFSERDAHGLAGKLAESMERLLRRWLSGAVRYTPSDFPSAQLSAAKLERVLADLNAED